MKEHNYIICMYDDHYEIVGPFVSQFSLSEWGDTWQEQNDDRPTWQSIYLDNPRALPVLISPAKP